jgi:hypothetical protein
LELKFKENGGMEQSSKRWLSQVMKEEIGDFFIQKQFRTETYTGRRIKPHAINTNTNTNTK